MNISKRAREVDETGNNRVDCWGNNLFGCAVSNSLVNPRDDLR